MGAYVLFLLRQEKYQKNAAKGELRVALPRAKDAPFGNPRPALGNLGGLFRLEKSNCITILPDSAAVERCGSIIKKFFDNVAECAPGRFLRGAALARGNATFSALLSRFLWFLSCSVQERNILHPKTKNPTPNGVGVSPAYPSDQEASQRR